MKVLARKVHMTVWDGNIRKNSPFGMTTKDEMDAFSAIFFKTQSY